MKNMNNIGKLTYFLLLLPYVFVIILVIRFTETMDNDETNATLQRIDRLEKMLLPPEGTEGRWPDRIESDARNSQVSYVERLRYLEKVVKGSINWIKDPHLWMKQQYKCDNMTRAGGEQFGHYICWDNWALQSEDCVIYDFGIRKEPHFGLMFAKEFGCEVHGFDPSPVTMEWLKGSTDIDDVPNYHIHAYGAGGHDGDLQLYEYNWEQVSIIEEKWKYDWEKKHMDYVKYDKFQLPVKTLKTIMEELGHSKITVMKLDIEGSEYIFLQDMFDTIGCPDIQQIAMEWHHFQYDWRYGSSPEVNALMLLLNDCGFKQFFTRPEWVVASDFETKNLLSYGLASFCKNCAKGETGNQLG